MTKILLQEMHRTDYIKNFIEHRHRYKNYRHIMTTYEEFALRLEDNRKELLKLLLQMIQNGPDLDEYSDARLTILKKSIDALTSLEISFANMFKIMQDPDWMNNYPFEIVIPARYVKDGYEMFIKMGFIQIYFSAIESSLRIYLRTIDPNVCNNSRGEYKKIYDNLLNRLNLQEFVPLLDLFRNIRNTIHNNGIFLPPNNEDVVVEYKGKKYHFKVGQVQMNTSWSDILFLVTETIEMIRCILINPIIKNLPDMNDPFAIQIWPIYANSNP